MTKRFDGYSLGSHTLAGPLETRFQAMHEAGFGKVMLDAADVAAHPGGVAAVVRALQTHALQPAGLQTLHDFEGLSGPMHRYKVEIAKAMLETCARIGAPLLLVSANTSAQASTDPAALAQDLHKLAMLAVPLGVRVAYKAVSWGHSVRGFIEAWDLVCRADCSNLGLGLDAFHILAAQNALDDLIEIEPKRIFLVQLSDFMWEALPDLAQRRQAARHSRVFPGQGAHSEALAELLVRLARLGYRGDYSLDAGNDDLAQLPARLVAEQAARSAQWLHDDVLHRGVDLPAWARDPS